MFWLNGCMGGRGRVKSAMQVVHSHRSIEVVLTKPRPSPLEQHCAGLPKACGNQLWERITSLLFPARNGHQQSSLGEGGDGWQVAESLRAQCGFEAAV